MKIGFIGTGVMGNAISVNLLKAGYEMVVYNRTKSKTDNLVSLGASWADSPKETKLSVLDLVRLYTTIS